MLPFWATGGKRCAAYGNAQGRRNKRCFRHAATSGKYWRDNNTSRWIEECGLLWEKMYFEN